MSRIPQTKILANKLEFETLPLVKPTGFREYDARWWFDLPTDEKPSELNPYGTQTLGEGLGTLMHERDIDPNIAIGHDFRHYSLGIKMALITGLMNTGVNVCERRCKSSPL